MTAPSPRYYLLRISRQVVCQPEIVLEWVDATREDSPPWMAFSGTLPAADDDLRAKSWLSHDAAVRWAEEEMDADHQAYFAVWEVWPQKEATNPTLIQHGPSIELSAFGVEIPDELDTAHAANASLRMERDAARLSAGLGGLALLSLFATYPLMSSPMGFFVALAAGFAFQVAAVLAFVAPAAARPYLRNA